MNNINKELKQDEHRDIIDDERKIIKAMLKNRFDKFDDIVTFMKDLRYELYKEMV